MESVLTRVTVPVTVLQDVVARAVKGSTFIDVIPLSGYMQIKIKDGKLSAKTTNNSYYLTTFSKDTISQPDFETVVDSKLFSNLVSKLSATSMVSLSVEGNKVVVESGKGKYTLPLGVDLSNNSLIQFPEVDFEPNGATTHLTCQEVRSILSLSKVCKANTKESPALFNYYFDTERALTTNDSKACYNPVKVVDRPSAITPDLIDLITSVMDEDDVKNSYGVDVSEDDSNIKFFSEKGVLVGKKASSADLSAFPSSELVEIFSKPSDTSADINRSELSNVIDRIGLFTNPYEQNKVTVTFTKDSISLNSEETESSEAMGYVGGSLPVDIEPVVIDVNAQELKEIVGACSAEQIKIYFDEQKVMLVLDGIKILLGSVAVE